jgi:hypothetical protein
MAEMGERRGERNRIRMREMSHWQYDDEELKPLFTVGIPQFIPLPAYPSRFHAFY